MNERIRELMVQADYPAPELALRAQKLAKLIVADVLDEVLQAMDDGMDVYDTVASKFGVKE